MSQAKNKHKLGRHYGPFSLLKMTLHTVKREKGESQNTVVMYVKNKNSKNKLSQQQRIRWLTVLIIRDKAFYLEAAGSHPGQGLEGSRD